MKEPARLQELWQLIPENHVVVLRVRTKDRAFYRDRSVNNIYEGCPYTRAFAKVVSVYCVARELVEITIEENLYTKEG